MKKYEKLMEQRAAALKEKQLLAEKIARLEEQQKTLEAEANAAAILGNTEKYRAKRDEAQLAKDTAYVCQKQLETSTETAPEKEVLAAWTEETDAYNKRFDEKQKAVEAAARALKAAYMDVIAEQKAILSIRKDLEECAGVQLPGKAHLLPQFFTRTGIPPELNAGLAQYKAPEYLYLLDSHLLNEAEADLINRVGRLLKV